MQSFESKNIRDIVYALKHILSQILSLDQPLIGKDSQPDFDRLQI